MPEKLHLRRIERENAGDADIDNIRRTGVPIIGPFFNIHDGRVISVMLLWPRGVHAAATAQWPDRSKPDVAEA